MTEEPERCPWCSAELPAAHADTCPSCGAHLTSAAGAEPDIKGVTSLDPLAIIQARADVARPRNRIMSFITGEAPGESEPHGQPRVARPARRRRQARDAPPGARGRARRSRGRVGRPEDRRDRRAEHLARRPCVRRTSRRRRVRDAAAWMPMSPPPRLPRACRRHRPSRAVGAVCAVRRRRSRGYRRREPDRRLRPPGILGECLTACPIRVPRICASRSCGLATATWLRGWPSPSTVPTTGGWPCSGWPTPTVS